MAHSLAHTLHYSSSQPQGPNDITVPSTLLHLKSLLWGLLLQVDRCTRKIKRTIVHCNFCIFEALSSKWCLSAVHIQSTGSRVDLVYCPTGSGVQYYWIWCSALLGLVKQNLVGSGPDVSHSVWDLPQPKFNSNNVAWFFWNKITKYH